MPRINRHGKVAIGEDNQFLFYDSNQLYWSSGDIPTSTSAGEKIRGSYNTWLNDTTLVFAVWEDSEGADGALFTYNINTRVTSRVSTSAGTTLFAGGDVWATWSEGDGYIDSETRTSADWGVLGVDDDGTVVITLNAATRSGLAYLRPDDTVPQIITYDFIAEGNVSIRNGVVIYPANGGIVRHILTGSNLLLNTPLQDITSSVFDDVSLTFVTTPVYLLSNDRHYVAGWHYGLNALVVFAYGSQVGWTLSSTREQYNVDIRVLADGRILVVSSPTEEESSQTITRYVVDTNEAPVYLYFDTNTDSTISSFARNYNRIAPVEGTDVVTVRANVDTNTGNGYAKIVASPDWFPEEGTYLRASWQYGITAVVANASNATATTVLVKDGLANEWDAEEPAYGSHSVYIQPDSATSQSAPLWSVTWVRDTVGANAAGTTYATIVLDVDLVPTGGITVSPMTFGAYGFRDVVAGVPVPIVSDTTIHTVGYTRMRLPHTSGDWTVGIDAASPIPRLIAYNSVENQAYVVENDASTVQPRVTIETDPDNITTAAVTRGDIPVVIRQSQFLPLGQIDYELGITPGAPTTYSPDVAAADTTPTTPTTSVASGAPAAESALSQGTRVFRQPRSVVPPAAAVKAAGDIAPTVFGTTSGTMDEEPPSYNPQYPYVTPLLESESGHLIEADDSPGAQRILIHHRAGSHIEMRPDGGVKYKTVSKRQDFTIGEQEIYVAGDCKITTDAGYCLHVRGGELVIDAKAGAAINVKGQLKLNAENIELKADNSIFLNAPKVDIGAIGPASMPIMSIPGGALAFPPQIPKFPGFPGLSPVGLIPKLNLPLPTAALTKIAKISSAVQNANPGALFKEMADTVKDVSGEPAFSKLLQQPEEIPLSSPGVYTATDTIERKKFRERVFDTPEDVNETEAYNTHVNLCLEKGDFGENDKKLPGQIYASDDTKPEPEPAPFLSFPLVSGSTVTTQTDNTTIVGVNTMFTEDVLPGQTIEIDGVRGVIRAISDDTTLLLSEPWKGATGTGSIRVYRLRPMRSTFGKFAYTDSDALGESGLTLGALMVNHISPVFEVPKVNAAAMSSWLSGGAGSGAGSGDDCGKPVVVPLTPVWDIIVRLGPLYNLSDPAGAGQFVEAVINEAPPEWGHIRKIPGQVQYNGHAIDAIQYKLPNGAGQGVDIIFSAGSPSARVQWLPVCAPDNPAKLWYR